MKNPEEILAMDIMTKEVLTINKKAPLSVFIDHLIEKKINGVPVVNDEGELVGIATKNDLLVYELTRELHSIYSENIHDLFRSSTKFDSLVKKGETDVCVEDIMVSDVIAVEPEASLQNVCSIMHKKKLNHVLVTKEDVIAGIITSRDIIHILSGLPE
jgi:CBS domain-containing protein